MTYRISVDSGGTFTDGVLIDEQGDAVMRKAHTTPQDPTVGVINCISKLADEAKLTLGDLLAQTHSIVLGTTLATNLVATKSGARMGTIATKGYRLRMAFPQAAKIEWREGPSDMYDFRTSPPPPLTPYYLMEEVEERLDYRGQVVTPLDEEDVRRAVRHLKRQGVEVIAVTLLFSQLNPGHEQRIAEIIKEEAPEIYVALSSTVLPVTGEVDRWGTTMFSAYVAPAVTRFVSKIKGLLVDKGFRGELLMIQSNGGIATPEIVIENPATLLLSGPAAGPSLGRSLGEAHGFKNVLSVDMGGTSFDVGVVYDGAVETVKQQVIDWKKFSLPCVDVDAIGAGGGSIAYVDSAGRLRVGPKSAGAFPGPACYGNGGEFPTVTDANVVLGYIDPDYFLGGETRLRKDLAEQAIKEKVADPLNLTVEQAAAAIYEVINSNMASGTDVSFAKRGFDPREFALCAAGGAAPVHAVKIMEELGIKKLIVPKVAPIYCAYGMMYCDLKHDYQRTYAIETAKADLARINMLFDEMEAAARETLRREGVSDGEMVIQRSMEMRYYGQFRERIAAVPAGVVTPESLAETLKTFHAVHEQTAGYSDAKYPTEIARLHLSGSAATLKPRLRELEWSTDTSGALSTSRRAHFAGAGFIETPVYNGDALLAGAVIEGPAIIESRFTTFVLPPSVKAEVDRWGNFVTTSKEG